MSTLSVVVITKNEEKNIRRCLDSVKWADEIVVVDSQSTDRTLEFAREYGAKIYSPVWRGFGPAKRSGVDKATSEWVLSLDADEELSAELAEQIQTIVRSNSDTAGYYVRRKTQFLGRWILHCGWYPDYILRLFRKSAGNVNNAEIHEKVVVKGEIERLSGEILHYSYPDLEHYFRKSNQYTSLGAQQAFDAGRKSGLFALVIKPPVSFITHYLLRGGFLDGIEGFVLSVLSASAVFVKYAKLRELWRQNRKGSQDR
ncbi:MAG: glycosyltransferase family 2 protein [bacterium]|nr:glycosyltransferase family 2 protein [bacterium]